MNEAVDALSRLPNDSKFHLTGLSIIAAVHALKISTHSEWLH